MKRYLKDLNENISKFLENLFEEEKLSIEYLNIRLENYFNAVLKEIKYQLHIMLKNKGCSNTIINQIENEIDYQFRNKDFMMAKEFFDSNKFNYENDIGELEKLYLMSNQKPSNLSVKRNFYGNINKNNTRIQKIINKINDEKLRNIHKYISSLQENKNSKNIEKEIKLEISKYKKEKKERILKDKLYENSKRSAKDFILSIESIINEYNEK